MDQEDSNKATTPADLAAAGNLEAQIRQFTDFSMELTGGGSVKKVMADVQAKSADLWQVPPEEIYVVPGYNPRTHNRVYYEGIADLGRNMARDGYMQDKPLSVYIAKIDGVDRLCLQDGHRRHAGVMYAKSELGAPIKTVPIVVKPKSENAVGLLKAMLHANEATPFTVYEKCVIAKRFKSFGWSDAEIAEEMRCTTVAVGQMLTIAGAPQAIQQLVDSGNVSATLAFETIKEHGSEQAGELLEAAVKSAKAKGKKRATAKDLLSAADQKARNSKKVAFDMYKLLVKITKDEAVVKKLDDKVLEEIDRCVAVVEKVRKVKPEPAPKPIKTKPAAKKPAAKKTAAKPAAKPAAKKSGNAKQQAADAAWSRAVGSNRVSRERRSMQ